MRILHLVHQYPPHYIGGTELYTETLARYQILSGHSVSIFCPYPQSGGDGSVEMDLEQDVRIFRVPLRPRSATRVFLNSFRQPQIVEALQGVLDEEKPDIIHVQHLMGLPMGLVNKIRAANIPFVITLHDYWYVCANAQLLTNTEQEICAGPNPYFTNCAGCAFARAGWEAGSWLAPSAAPLFRNRHSRLHDILKQAQRLIAPTNFVYQTYAELGAPTDKMIAVPHGLELPYESITNAIAFRANRGLRRPLQIGYIGGINWQKGIHVLIEAVNKMPAEEVQLTIYGDMSSFPEYAERLRMISKHPGTKLAGPISHEKIWLALADLDLLVLPTLWYETSSLILDEAFAVGIPVIASRIGVMVEKIEEGTNGLLFPVGDVDALSEILNNVLNNPDMLENWQKGIPPVRHIEDHVRDIEEVYNEAVLAV